MVCSISLLWGRVVSSCSGMMELNSWMRSDTCGSVMWWVIFWSFTSLTVTKYVLVSESWSLLRCRAEINCRSVVSYGDPYMKQSWSPLQIINLWHCKKILTLAWTTKSTPKMASKLSIYKTRKFNLLCQRPTFVTMPFLWGPHLRSSSLCSWLL